MQRLMLFVISIYQRFISPLLPPRCRFYPTCSQYAKQAVETHGAAHGGYLAAKRCLKCHPFHAGGIDHVPEPGNAGHPSKAGNQA